ncbi:DUF5808 domain-containing protein [Leifsonia kafniensis]|uniref:DUF5808 domain-containing protein n=1 Tax=Leifsonia kafniensis TaxID=475957 RepID=A0ABP7KD72_9MICO
MSWFALVLPLVTTIFIAVMLYLMPSITRPTLPLGVSIPQERVGEPVIGAAVRRYRVGIAIALAVSVALTFIFAAVSPVSAVIVPIFVLLIFSFSSYWLARTSIQRAKAAGHWYQDVPVRLSGTLTATSTHASTPIGWYVASTLLLTAVAAVGVSVYDSLPETLATHWNAAGVADGFATKSVWSVFGPLLIGLGMTAFLFVVARLTGRIPMRRVADYGAEQQLAMQQLMQQLVGQITLVIAALFAALSLLAWYAPHNVGANLAVGIVGPVLLFAVIVVFLVRQRRIVRQGAAVVAAAGVSGAGTSAGSLPSTAHRADTPDDDRFWKGGMIYLNRDDPALWVPKRFGVGWTVNLGHPGGIAIMTIPVLIIIGVVIFATISPN